MNTRKLSEEERGSFEFYQIEDPKCISVDAVALD
jgi:hypothetical protein